MSKILSPSDGLVSPSGPDIEITITLDTKTNKTTMKAPSTLNRLTLASILQQHALTLTNSLIEAAIKERGKV